jgi:cytochrome c oxidase subunit 1
VGAFLIATSVLVFIVNIVHTKLRGEPCGEDPWDARTLEWATSSPPPEFNFAEIPIVTNRDEWWHRKYTEDEDGRLVRLPAGAATATAEPEAHHHIHMPSPSYWPLLFTIGLPILGYGFVFKNWWLVGLGAVWLMFGMTGWATEPSTEPGT